LERKISPPDLPASCKALGERLSPEPSHHCNPSTIKDAMKGFARARAGDDVGAAVTLHIAGSDVNPADEDRC